MNWHLLNLQAGALLLLGAVLISAACGGNKSSSKATGEMTVPLISTDVAVGEQRLSFGLINSDQEPVVNAKLKVRIFKVAGDVGTLVGEGDAYSIKVTQTYTDKHEDGRVETHKAGDVGVYAVYMTFTEPGDYGFEVSGKAGNQTVKPIQVPFKVQPVTSSVPVGQPAPASVQPTFRDVKNLSEIDTSDPPDPDMHRLTVTEALGNGKPTLVVFATPAFCTSRICGPMKQVVDSLFAQYKAQVNFIHIEPYDLEKARNGGSIVVLPILAEWGLRTEPWVFVIDKQGKVHAKFEAAAAAPEIDLPLREVLGLGKR